MEEIEKEPAAQRGVKMHVLCGPGLGKGVQETQATWWIYLHFYRKSPQSLSQAFGVICFNNILNESRLSGNRISFYFYEVKNEK